MLSAQSRQDDRREFGGTYQCQILSSKNMIPFFSGSSCGFTDQRFQSGQKVKRPAPDLRGSVDHVDHGLAGGSASAVVTVNEAETGQRACENCCRCECSCPCRRAKTALPPSATAAPWNNCISCRLQYQDKTVRNGIAVTHAGSAWNAGQPSVRDIVGEVVIPERVRTGIEGATYRPIEKLPISPNCVWSVDSRWPDLAGAYLPRFRPLTIS